MADLQLTSNSTKFSGAVVSAVCVLYCIDQRIPPVFEPSSVASFFEIGLTVSCVLDSIYFYQTRLPGLKKKSCVFTYFGRAINPNSCILFSFANGVSHDHYADTTARQTTEFVKLSFLFYAAETQFLHLFLLMNKTLVLV